jgi:hypothetical protein
VVDMPLVKVLAMSNRSASRACANEMLGLDAEPVETSGDWSARATAGSHVTTSSCGNARAIIKDCLRPAATVSLHANIGADRPRLIWRRPSWPSAPHTHRNNNKSPQRPAVRRLSAKPDKKIVDGQAAIPSS